MKALFISSLLWLATPAFSQTFTLSSSGLGGQATLEQVFSGFGCSGENKSPELRWTHPPEGTKSFAVTIYDEDAPTGSGWWHWLIFDIPATENGLVKNAGDPSKNLAPKGAIQSMTDFGKTGYGGPCPPPGTGIHRYVITVYALRTEKLGTDADAVPAMVGFNLEHKVIEKASVVFYYHQ